ncbi:hypothetical protein ANO11243_092100 [Dothideomycetidae sp. 11243]|nr:hypothetical protein ANO11243_092100 [fungal sp. No.11243]
MLSNIEYPDKTDLPHIAGTLVSYATLQNEAVDRAELLATIWLMQYRLHIMRCQDSLMPITDQCCRLFVGRIDPVEKLFHVQKSSIVDFDYDGHHDAEDWKRVPCWMMAEPTGETKIVPDDSAADVAISVV